MPYCVGDLIKLHPLQLQLHSLGKGMVMDFQKKKKKEGVDFFCLFPFLDNS